MPIYEFRCHSCGKRSSQFLRTFSQDMSSSCPHCGGQKLRRLVSRVAVLKGSDSLNWLPSAETMGDVDESDPKSLARWMKRWRKDMGAELGSEAQDAIDMMEAGFTPEDLAATEQEDS